MDEQKSPIYIQIGEWLENQIIDGELEADEKVYSQYQLAEIFNVNPATAGKGITILFEENLLYKKRGLGMFVEASAKEKILEKRRTYFLHEKIEKLVVEAKRLNVSEQQLINMMKKLYGEG